MALLKFDAAFKPQETMSCSLPNGFISDTMLSNPLDMVKLAPNLANTYGCGRILMPKRT